MMPRQRRRLTMKAIMLSLFLAAPFLAGTLVTATDCAKADFITAPEVFVTCCCQTLSGGACCADVAFCSGFIPGCMCK